MRKSIVGSGKLPRNPLKPDVSPVPLHLKPMETQAPKPASMAGADVPRVNESSLWASDPEQNNAEGLGPGDV